MSSLRVACDMTFPDRNRGGVGRYARGLVEAFHECGDVDLVPIRSRWAAGMPGTARWLADGAAREVRRIGADVLHGPAFVTPWRCPAPVVITVHDNSVERFPAGHPLEWRLFATRVLPSRARSARAVIVPSHFVREELIEAWGLPEDRVFAVAHGIDPHFAAGADSRAPASPSLLFVGAPIHRKNLDIVLRAMAGAAPGSAVATARLLITGARAEDFPRLGDAIARSGLAQRVRWLGPVPDADMPELYRSAGALVYPSLDEGFGLPPLEAMASGTPVVAAAAGALPETAGDAALLADPHDPEAITAAIETALTDTEQRARLIAAGLARAAEFTWQRCARSTAAVYRQVGEAPNAL